MSVFPSGISAPKNAESPVFSVIMATLNPGAKLEATLHSVLEQGGSWELLIFDGGSEDGTPELLRATAERDKRVRWWSEPDKGVWDGFNKGIDAAQGRYLYFLPAGDRIRPGVFERVAGELPTHERGFVYGRVFLEEYGVERDRDMTPLELACRNIPHQAVFYGRDIFKLFGPYNLRYPIYADHPINIRSFADNRVEVKYLDMVMADFEGFGLSSTKPDLNMQRDLPRIVRRYMGSRIAARHAVYHFLWKPLLLLLRGIKRGVMKKAGIDPDRGRRSHAARTDTPRTSPAPDAEE